MMIPAVQTHNAVKSVLYIRMFETLEVKGSSEEVYKINSAILASWQ
jgi:hypothetical protein